MNNRILGVTDFLLFALIVLISAFGLILLYSATNQDIDIVIKQGTKLSFCFVLMLIIGSININKLKLLTPYIYLLCLMLLVVTLFWGHDSKGAKRWILFYGFSLQVSEILKIIVPMMLAWYISNYEDKEIEFKKLIISFIIVFIPITFIVKQPDLGTSLIILLCGLITLFLSGVKNRHIKYLLGISFIITPLMWKFFLLSYQKQRIMTLIEPESDPLGSGYHIIQSKIAVGSGGFFGKGFLNGTQSQLEFLPERGTDFIFAVFAKVVCELSKFVFSFRHFFVTLSCPDSHKILWQLSTP